MRKIVHECVGCPPEMGCNKQTCRYWNSIELYCDKCKELQDVLYHFDGQELCLDCVEKKLEKVDGSDY